MQEINKSDIAKLINRTRSLVLDIGCYDGKDAMALSFHLNSPEIHCFEADPRSQKLFDRISGGAKHLTLHRIAIGSHDGETTLYQSDSGTRRHYVDQKEWSASSSLKEPKGHLELFPDVEFNLEKAIRVPCITLDTWYTNIYPREIDFIWADVNGSEGDLVAGGNFALNHMTRYLYIETSDKELYKGQVKQDELLKMLPNFEIVGKYNDYGNFANILLKNKTL